MLSLRIGYLSCLPVDEPEFTDFGDSKFTCGAGAEYRISAVKLQLNYSFITSLTLMGQHTHSMSLTFRKVRYIEKFIE